MSDLMNDRKWLRKEVERLNEEIRKRDVIISEKDAEISELRGNKKTFKRSNVDQQDGD